MSVDADRVEIGPFEEGDEESILSGFAEVFTERRTRASWTWAFRDNPAGRFIWVGKTPEGRVASHYASIPRRARVQDRGVALFGESVDSFVLPEFRQGLKREGLFVRTYADFIDKVAGPQGEVAMYGLPLPGAYRIGRKLMSYEQIHRILFNVRALEPGGDPKRDLGDACRAEPLARFGEETDRLAERVLASERIVVLRDAPYLNWRYVDRPEIPYDRWLFRGPDAAAIGLAVLRHGWGERGDTALAELLLDPAHPKAAEVITWIERRAASRGSARALAMFRPECVQSAGLAHLGWQLEKSGYRLVARTDDDSFVTMDEMQAEWWFSFGDFDVV